MHPPRRQDTGNPAEFCRNGANIQESVPNRRRDQSVDRQRASSRPASRGQTSGQGELRIPGQPETSDEEERLYLERVQQHHNANFQQRPGDFNAQNNVPRSTVNRNQPGNFNFPMRPPQRPDGNFQESPQNPMREVRDPSVGRLGPTNGNQVSRPQNGQNFQQRQLNGNVASEVPRSPVNRNQPGNFNFPMRSQNGNYEEGPHSSRRATRDGSQQVPFRPQSRGRVYAQGSNSQNGQNNQQRPTNLNAAPVVPRNHQISQNPPGNLQSSMRPLTRPANRNPTEFLRNNGNFEMALPPRREIREASVGRLQTPSRPQSRGIVDNEEVWLERAQNASPFVPRAQDQNTPVRPPTVRSKSIQPRGTANRNPMDVEKPQIGANIPMNEMLAELRRQNLQNLPASPVLPEFQVAQERPSRMEAPRSPALPDEPFLLDPNETILASSNGSSNTSPFEVFGELRCRDAERARRSAGTPRRSIEEQRNALVRELDQIRQNTPIPPPIVVRPPTAQRQLILPPPCVPVRSRSAVRFPRLSEPQNTPPRLPAAVNPAPRVSRPLDEVPQLLLDTDEADLWDDDQSVQQLVRTNDNRVVSRLADFNQNYQTPSGSSLLASNNEEIDLEKLTSEQVDGMTEQKCADIVNQFYDSNPRLKFKESYPFMADGFIQKDAQLQGVLKVFSSRLGKVSISDTRQGNDREKDYVYFLVVRAGEFRGFVYYGHPVSLSSAKFPNAERIVLRGHALLVHPTAHPSDAIKEERWTCFSDTLGLLRVISGAARTQVKKDTVWNKQLDVVRIDAGFENGRFVVTKITAVTARAEKMEMFPLEAFMVIDGHKSRTEEDSVIYHSKSLGIDIHFHKTTFNEWNSPNRTQCEIVVVPTFPRSHCLQFRGLVVISTPSTFWSKETEWIRQILRERGQAYRRRIN